MEISFSKNGWSDFTYWIETDKDMIVKIKALIQSIHSTPFKGLGKPEPLKHDFRGFWSRRITQEHRLIYSITGTKGKDQKCLVIQCRYHYTR